MSVLRVATCQFPVSASAEASLRYIKRQLRTAKDSGADVAHFPEAALSGYAGTDMPSFEGYDWDALRAATAELLGVARRLGIWVIVGSAHRLSDGHKPHNCLYVIDDSGQIADRYDKRFCSDGDLMHYSPGDHTSVWKINGVTCGAQICYEYRFPELYRQLKREGVDLVFHSYHAGNASAARMAAIRQALSPEFAPLNNSAATFTYPGITMPSTMTAAAAANHVWISCANTSRPQSAWPAFVVRADGITVGRLRRNVAGVLITTVDTEQELYDSTAAWRGNAMTGTLHSGTLVTDPRSADRTSLLRTALPRRHQEAAATSETSVDQKEGRVA
jgi:predicted amidohydrolase